MSLRKDLKDLWNLPATVARASDTLTAATQGAIVEAIAKADGTTLPDPKQDKEKPDAKHNHG